jgi:outer membrane protein assembly factor BamB
VPEGGQLAFALAEKSDFYVVSQEGSAHATQQARDAARRVGLLGKRMTIVEAPWDASVLADCYANLIVMTRLTDGRLPKLDPQAVLAKVAPHGGRAVLGLAASEEGILTQSQLETWAGELEGANTQVVSDDLGLWLVIERRQLPGAAEWTHRYYRAHNNPLSDDTAFRWPPAVQWLEKPFHDGGSLSLLAGGRVFIVFSGYGSKAARVPNNPKTRNLILVRDAYNGRELWRYQGADTDAGIERRMSLLVAIDDICYLAEPKTQAVRELDAATGKELRRFEVAAQGREVKWIAVEDGILCAMIGTLDTVQKSGDQWRWFGRQYTGSPDKGDPYAIDLGDEHVALDLESGRELWRHKEDKPGVHETSNAVLNGRVYSFSRHSGLRSVELRTGKTIWVNTDCVKTWTAMAEKRPFASFGHHGALLVSEDAGIVYIPNVGGLAFATQDGRELWHFRGPYHPLIRGKRVFTASGAGFRADEDYANTVIDLMTGEADKAYIDRMFGGKVPVGSACGSFSQSGLFHGGSWGMTYSFESSLLLGGNFGGTYNNHRNNCNGVPIFAGGLLFNQAYECTCSYKLRGQTMEICDPKLPRHAQAGSDRLRQGQLTPLGRAAMDADWPAQRGGNDRSASSPLAIAGRGQLLWHLGEPVANPPFVAGDTKGSGLRTSDPVRLPVPPIVVGDTAFRTTSDGVVTAHALADGAVRWRFIAGAQPYVSPTWWRGTLLVGSGDGYVYSLDAATGQERWRFQAAPEERRIFVYGHMVSTWPVAANVTVQNGKAYVAASLLSSNGSYLYCLDANTGELIWQNNQVGTTDMDTLSGGLSLLGLTTIAGGKLWVQETGFELADGTGLGNDKGSFSRYTGCYDDDIVFTGGWRFFGNQLEWQNIKDKYIDAGLTAQSITQITRRGPKRAIFLNRPLGFGAWDEGDLAACMRGDRIRKGRTYVGLKPELVFWPAAAVRQHIDACFAEEDPRKVSLPPQSTSESLVVGGEPGWRVQRDGLLGCALTKDHVLALCREDAASDQHGTENAVESRWHLSAVSRHDGSEAWVVDLPAIPLEDGIAVAANGTVLVQLLDGTIAAIGN